jgi:NADH:ubiquinone reductase (H+-translocating)
LCNNKEGRPIQTGNTTSLPRVIIIGAGFGGLYAARTLAKKAVQVLLIDRNNYHTFTPLLYQVATCALDPGEIAYPVRSIFRGATNIQFLLGEVVDIDVEGYVIGVTVNKTMRREHYDYLIVAAGSETNFYEMGQNAQYVFGLKTLSEAVLLRNHILKLLEKAVWADDVARKQSLTTFVVVGGGATGVETAGALHELYNKVLKKEYPDLESIHARVLLIEAADDILLSFPEGLRHSALQQIQSLGVEPLLGKSVISVNATSICLNDGQTIPTHTVVWAAGVKASPLAIMLSKDLKQHGRIPVHPTLEAIGTDKIYVIGDMAYLEDEHRRPYPGLIPVAKQQGILAAQNILRHEVGDEMQSFRYTDRGIMATIGRSRAVAWIYNRVPLSGYLAWLSWLILHLVTLMGFRNRLNVFVNWVWNYLTHDRSVRIILEYRWHHRDHEL